MESAGVKRVILILDTTFLIDYQRVKRSKGRKRAKLFIQKLVKSERNIIALWIPRTVKKEFLVGDREKRYEELIFSDLGKFLIRLGIHVRDCPVHSRSVIREIAGKLKSLQIHNGEMDAFHQALLISRYRRYAGHVGVVVSNDLNTKKAEKILKVPVKSIYP